MSETGKIEFSREDIEWKVEQKLARLLAERDRFTEGFWTGLLIGVAIVAYLAFTIWPEVKRMQ